MRPSKIDYYLKIAEVVCARSTCLRRNYGAIIVKNDEVVSTGYNGAPRGRANCSELGKCLREEMKIPSGQQYELCRSVHAEANAIISASRNEMIGATMYLAGKDASTGDLLKHTTSCSMCRRMIINAGIKDVVIRDGDNDYIRTEVDQWINEDDVVPVDCGCNARVPESETEIWKQLKNASNSEERKTILEGVKQIPLTLLNGDKVDLDVGCDESGKIFFVFHNVMRDSHCMNSEATKMGGWRDSDMRRYVNNDVYNLLPEEVKAIIKPTTIIQVQNGKRIEITDKLFCLSATQVFGREYWSEKESEDTQIDIFRDHDYRIKTYFGKECPFFWWLRSATNSNAFNYVSTSGSINYTSATHSYGVVLGFCIESD